MKIRAGDVVVITTTAAYAGAIKHELVANEVARARLAELSMVWKAKKSKEGQTGGITVCVEVAPTISERF